MSTTGDMSVVLRPMTVAEFAHFLRSSVAAYAAALVEAGEASPDAAERHVQLATTRLLPHGQATPGMLFLVAEAPGVREPVGQLWLQVSRPELPCSAWVYDVVVSEPHRGRGYGRAIMLAAERELARRGIGELGLNVFAGNATANALYDSLAYRTTSRHMVKTFPVGQA
jgi:GNAT superfamily N-acetyltransferase